MNGESFEMDEGWLVFHPNPSRPEFAVPEGAVDAHCHVFGPGSVFPFALERKYTPCDASKEQLWDLRELLGFERNVIVQATCHGTDNRALVDALVHSKGSARGVASVRRNVTDEELKALHDAGVRGIRFNFVKRLVNVLPTDTLQEIAERIEPLGMHLVVYLESEDLPELMGMLASLRGTVVFDHMGRPDVRKGAASGEFDRFINLMGENENMWAKVSCPERLSASGPPGYDDVIPFARRVLETFPDRVLWGTDWPHPNMKSHMPDDGKLVDYIPRIAVTGELQRKLLVQNPMNLYWPEEAGRGA